MPRIGGRPVDYYPQQSRDYALANTIKCQCVVCPVNKNGYCETPALIQITSGGKCKTAISFIGESTSRDETTKPEPKDLFTPDWFHNRWDCNCPRLRREEMEDYRDGHPEKWAEDVIRVNLERK
jgi:hypothetical protein